MAWVDDEIGRAIGRPAALGGIPLDTLGATGYGLAICLEVLQEHGVLELSGARIAVQGFGAVGRNVALQLHQRGARVIAVSDIDGAVANPDGLDVPKLAAYRLDRPLAEFPGGVSVERDDVIGTACDVLVPAAQPDVLNRTTVDQVRARFVLEGANIPATEDAERLLEERGILVIPDIIANAGGVICGAAETRGLTPAQAFTDISERMRSAPTVWLGRLATAESPRRAARDMAIDRIHAARAYRRTF
jgi:glutamate dehydrogenase/leucine dehydrogenase